MYSRGQAMGCPGKQQHCLGQGMPVPTAKVTHGLATVAPSCPTSFVMGIRQNTASTINSPTNAQLTENLHYGLSGLPS